MDAHKQRALVTGASSGLGVEIARVLAQRGIDLTISARRRDRLETVAGELRQAHGIDVAVITADLSTPHGPQQLFDAVQATGKRIDVVVNNAGFGHFGPFLEQSLAQIDGNARRRYSSIDDPHTAFRGRDETTRGRAISASFFVRRIAAHSSIQRLFGSQIVRGNSYAGSAARTEAGRSSYKRCRAGLHAHGISRRRASQKTRLMRLLSMPASYVARKAVAGMFRGKMVITPGLFYQLNGLALGFVPRRWPRRYHRG